MKKEEIFQMKFVRPLVDCYGVQKLPPIRIKALWEKMKNLPEFIYQRASEKIILNCDLFPGLPKILEVVSEVSHEFMKTESDRIKAETKCFKCRSQGVIVVNNYAYKCNCRLGDLCYPNYPIYEGQVQEKEGHQIGIDGEYIYENAVMASIVPKNCRDIRQIKTIIKIPFNDDRKKMPIQVEFQKMDFPGFIKEIKTRETQ